MRKGLLFIAAGIVAIAILAPVAVRSSLRHLEREMLEHKSARHTTGVVTGKKYVQFGSDQTTYRDDEGQSRILQDRQRRDGEFRIFFTIDNFNQVPHGAQVSLAAAEEVRFKKFGPRYTIVDAKEFERIEIGQRIEIVYRWANDSQIEMIAVEMNPPVLQKIGFAGRPGGSRMVFEN